MLRMALRRSITNPFTRADLSEPDDESRRGGESETVNAELEEQRGAQEAAEGEAVPCTYRRSTTSVFSSLSGHRRLSSRVFTSPPKKLFGHLAGCGDRLRHRAGTRTKIEESNEADGVAVLESKALPGTVTTKAPDVTAPSSTAPWHSKSEDRSLPSSGQQESCEKRQHQQHLVNRCQQLTPQYRQQHHPQDAAEWETGKGKLEPPKAEEEQEQSEHSVIDTPCISTKCTHQPHRQRSVFAEKTYSLQAPAIPSDRASLRKPEHPLEHRYSTSTTSASRRSSNGSENVPANLASLSDRHEASVAADIFSTHSGSPTSSCSVNNGRYGSRPEHVWRRESIKGDNSDGQNTTKGKRIGVDAGRGECSISKKSSCETEEGRIKRAGHPLYPHGRLHDNSTFAGRDDHSLAGSTGETSSHHFLHWPHEIHGSLYSPGDTTPPVLMRAALADMTSTPEDVDGSVSPCGSGTHFAATSAVDSGTSSALLSAASPASSAPARSTATSADAATTSGRFKRTVGMRLSEMLLQGRTALKLGSGEKDAVATPRRLARSRTVPNLSPSAHPASAASAQSSSPSKSGDGVLSFETTRLSLFPRSPPSLLRQLRRRAPGGLRRGADPAAVDTAAIRDEEDYHQRGLRPKAVSGVGGGKVISKAADERTRDTTRRAGVLRRGREETSARRGGEGTGAGSITRGRGTAMRGGAREGLAARRVTSSGVSDTSGEGGGQVKCVRFGSMSIHVYTREARIRSCSSDSVNFAVTLDPPAPTDAHQRCARDGTTRAFGHATDDFDEDAEPDSAEEAESGNEDEEEEEEEIRGYQGHEEGRAYHPAGGRHNRLVFSRDDVNGTTEHAAGAAAERKRGPALQQLSSVPYTGDTLHHGTRWRERAERHFTGRWSAKEAEAVPSALGGERDGHVGKSDRSDSTIDLAAERYPSAFEDFYGKPRDSYSSHDSYEKQGSFIDMCLALSQEQQKASAACGDSIFSPVSTLEISSRHASGEHEDTAAAHTHDSAQSTAADRAHILESCKVGEGDTHVREFPQHSPLTTDHELETIDAAHSTSTRKTEPNTADWWRCLLSSSSSEAEEHFADMHQQHRVTQIEQRDKLAENEHVVHAEEKGDAPKPGQLTPETSPAVHSHTAGESSADSVPAVSEICRESATFSHGSLVSSRDQRSKNKEPVESGLEQPGSGEKHQVTDEGSGSSGRRVRASTLEDVGLPRLRMQSRAKDIDPLEKGMKRSENRWQLVVSPRRVHSDEYPGRVSPYMQWQRVLSDTLSRKGEHEGEAQQSQFELKYMPTSSKKKAAPIPGHTQKQQVRGTDDSSPFLLAHGPQKLLAEADSQSSTRDEQPCLQEEKKSVYSDKLGDLAMELQASSPYILSRSTIASSGLHSKDSSASTFQDVPSRYTSSDIFAEPDRHSRTGSHSTIVPCGCSSLSSVPCAHSTTAVAQQHTSADGTAKQPDAPQGHQQRPLLHQQSRNSDGSLPQREMGSRSSMTSGGRSSLDEEMLNKAAEEAIARSASHMSAEEKENLREILKGWCS